ncbi:MAG: HAMP domain-containing histidine kinase [Epsilonproteobacteria bacterium]|nr:HAMP domain-containing histidine kinase [Campylobacterota bacterium]
MFRSVELSLIALYLMTSAVVLGSVYGVYEVLGVHRWDIIALIAFSVGLGMGKIVSKVAMEPLKEYIDHLDRFSKETLHELNLPINTITANLSMLRKTHEDEKSIKRLDRIEMATVMLKERYNELDYLIKKQMEKESIETFDIRDLIDERLAFLKPLYPHVQWEIMNEPCLVTLDRKGFGKVIDNLVDNGVKYSPSAALITLSLHDNKLSICDEGLGMDEMTLVHIFDRYYQSDSTMAGYGIGLGLVKRYCDRYKIGLHVHSQLGEGTCVTLELNRGKNGK